MGYRAGTLNTYPCQFWSSCEYSHDIKTNALKGLENFNYVRFSSIFLYWSSAILEKFISPTQVDTNMFMWGTICIVNHIRRTIIVLSKHFENAGEGCNTLILQRLARLPSLVPSPVFYVFLIKKIRIASPSWTWKLFESRKQQKLRILYLL